MPKRAQDVNGPSGLLFVGPVESQIPNPVVLERGHPARPQLHPDGAVPGGGQDARAPEDTRTYQ